eukprot:scaffold2784_cov109-Cylindrotheca_fusiformis.AAC.8
MPKVIQAREEDILRNQSDPCRVGGKSSSASTGRFLVFTSQYPIILIALGLAIATTVLFFVEVLLHS